MTKKKIDLPETKWIYGDELSKWVYCLSCFHEYYIESFELSPCCPMCESKEFEESVKDKGYLDYDELDGLL